eukprot:6207808-Pleurochrysis_carterae.AAC.2
MLPHSNIMHVEHALHLRLVPDGQSELAVRTLGHKRLKDFRVGAASRIAAVALDDGKFDAVAPTVILGAAIDTRNVGRAQRGLRLVDASGPTGSVSGGDATLDADAGADAAADADADAGLILILTPALILMLMLMLMLVLVLVLVLILVMAIVTVLR